MRPDPVEEVFELIADGAHAPALAHLDQLIREEPYHGGFVALRALVHADLDQAEDAARDVRAALAVDPGHPFVHYAAAAVALKAGEVGDAIGAAREAQRLAPPYPAAAMLEARARAMAGQWGLVATIARGVLEVEPGNDEAAVLAEIAASADADAPLDSEAWQALSARFPLNPTARAANGWGHLEGGRIGDARREFEQALALDGGAAWAREGLVLALKARSPVYAVLLRYFIWSSRLPDRTRNLMAIGGVIGYNVLRRTSRSQPELAPLILPLLVAYAGFVLLTWLADPLLSLVLLSDRESRPHLSRDDRNAGLAVGASLALAAALGIVGALLDADRVGIAAIPIAFATLAVAAHFATESSAKRDRLGVAALLALGFGLASLVAPADLQGFAVVLSILIAIASTWYARFATANPKFA